MHINVIMPVYLGDYPNAATNRKFKLVRAIQSFLKQDYDNKKLIIVADGCLETMNFVKNNFKNENIELNFVSKQPMFSGNVRNFGLTLSSSEIITYLDADDFYKKDNHLSVIVNAFNSNDKLNWVYFNDFIKYQSLDHLPLAERNADLTFGTTGTSNIAHKNLHDINWEGCDGYGHDFTFIQKMKKLHPDAYTKISGCSYVCCHIPNGCDN